jgi:RimJ/RimL family protein N-acetyltransferase
VQLPRYQIAWSASGEALLAVEPTADEVAAHAAALTAAYNDPHNAPLLGHGAALDDDDVVAHYAALAARGDRGFLMFRGGALVADGDLRGIANGAAEFAFLVVSVSAQGKGLGTRLATMIHAFAFAQLRLARVYASFVPDNTASRRVFEKLGYTVDASPAARGYADDPGDVTMAIDRATFERSHARAMAEIRVAVR